MTTVKLHYVKESRGLLFWQPNAAMREMGFEPKALGPNGPEAQTEAIRLYQLWTEARQTKAKATTYPPGSLGAYFERFTGRYSKKPALKWRKMKPRSREDYHRAWVHIEPVFARKTLTAISGQQIEKFVDDGEGNGIAFTLSDSERYRTLKVLRALFEDAILRLRLDMPNPALVVANPQARGRAAIWLGAEIEQLAAGAHRLGYHGMGVAIRIAWDTLFSPIDVWSLKRSAVRLDREGWYVERERTKTAKAAFGALSPDTALALGIYTAALPFEIPADGQIIRQRNGHGYRSKDTFGDDFRAVRSAVFPGDTRKFMDIRRSGNVEADAAGADKSTMGELLANNIASSKFLDDTYTPPTVAKARVVAQQRLTGRERLKVEIDRITRSKSAG